MRTILLAVAIAGLAVPGCGGRGKTWSDARKEREAAEIPKVSYLVQDGSPTVNLWSDSGRTAKSPTHRVPAGTKCQILVSEDVDKSRGKTMHRVRAVTGEEGWVPDQCIDWRKK